MKKIYNKLLIISIICAIISFSLCFFSAISNDFDFTTTKGVINEVNEMGSDNPGGGWYLLMAGGTAAMVDIATGIANLIIIILIPSFMLFVIMISQCIARLVQIGQQKNWKDITSKILTYISIVLQILLCLVLIFNLLSNLSFNRILLLLALILNIACLVLFIKELFRSKDKKMLKQCNQTIKGKVIKNNPQNPKKSYVMRFVKNPAIKVFLVTGLLFVILSFAGLMFLPNGVNNVKEDLYTIVIPEAFFEYSGSNATEAATSYMNLGEDFCTSAVAKGNDLIVEVTGEQRKNMIKRNNNNIEELINDFENSNINYDVIQSQDYKTLTIYADENFTTTLFVKVSLGVSSCYMLNNILENDNQDWSVYLKIVNCNTGKTVAEGNVPQDTLSFGPEEWKASY